MDQVPVSSSFVRMCQTLHSEHLSHSHSHSLTHSQLRLGTVLKLMDICACLSIEHLSRTSCVTASMDHLVFSNECVTAGEALNIEASVVRCFNSSAEVVCRVVIDPAMSLHSHSQSKSRGVRCLVSCCELHRIV
jgi:acyl-CoA hydrolase